MKVFGVIVKLVLALAAIAGLIYVAATYGDKIVAWAKKTLGLCKGCCEGEVIIEEAAEEVTAEEEVPAEEAPVAESEVTENDFEG